MWPKAHRDCHHHEVESREVEELIGFLVDTPAHSARDVIRRCSAADRLALLGPAAARAVPALRQTLVVPVTVDCELALRVAAAAALWKVGQCWTLTVPFLLWALKDEYWGVAPRAAEILGEIGHAAVVPDLIRLAERRLSHGPFSFEQFASSTDQPSARPFLAILVDALVHCSRGRRGGPSYISDVRNTLKKLAACEDEQIRVAAQTALVDLPAAG